MRSSSPVVLAGLLALAGCASSIGLGAPLSAQTVQSLMDQGEIAGILVGHSEVVVTLESGEKRKAYLPPFKKVEEYIRRRESIGDPVDYQME